MFRVKCPVCGGVLNGKGLAFCVQDGYFGAWLLVISAYLGFFVDSAEDFRL